MSFSVQTDYKIKSSIASEMAILGGGGGIRSEGIGTIDIFLKITDFTKEISCVPSSNMNLGGPITLQYNNGNNFQLNFTTTFGFSIPAYLSIDICSASYVNDHSEVIDFYTYTSGNVNNSSGPLMIIDLPLSSFEEVLIITSSKPLLSVLGGGKTIFPTDLKNGRFNYCSTMIFNLSNVPVGGLPVNNNP
jgi:hypothetical protein